MHQRYAFFYMPQGGTPLSEFGEAWLGWSALQSLPMPHPALPGFSPVDIAAITATPRKYGFHGTLKPPMRLRQGKTDDALMSAAEVLAARIAPFDLAPLHLTRMGGFLALTTDGNDGAMADLAATLVAGMDDFRALPDDAELARRRAAGLSPAQEVLLQKWGYPYVMDEFRFHLTLSGRLDDDTISTLMPALDDALKGIIGVPLRVSDVALAGEASDGRFHLIRRFALTG